MEYNQNNTNVSNPQYSQQNMEQQIMYQQMMQQQMMNQMMQQQQQLMKSNEELARKNQQIYGSSNFGYSNNQMKPIKIVNVMSLIAALVTIMVFIGGPFLRIDGWYGWETFSLNELLDSWFWEEMVDEGIGNSFLIWLASMLPVILIVLIVTTFIGGFVSVRKFSKWVVATAILSAASMLYLFIDFCGDETFSCMGSGWFFLIGGIVLSCISVSKDEGPKHYNPENNNLNIGEWRCPKCDTRNTGTACKICGMTRR